MDDPDLRIGAVPVLGHGVKDEPEFRGFLWLDGGRRERLKVDVRFSRPNPAEGLGFVLHNLMRFVAKKHLDRNS